MRKLPRGLVSRTPAIASRLGAETGRINIQNEVWSKTFGSPSLFLLNSFTVLKILGDGSERRVTTPHVLRLSLAAGKDRLIFTT